MSQNLPVNSSCFNDPFPNDFSKLKEFTDDSFECDENGRKLPKCLENTVGKGEIACCKQFLLFSQCFQDLYCRHVKTRGLINDKSLV